MVEVAEHREHLDHPWALASLERIPEELGVDGSGMMGAYAVPEGVASAQAAEAGDEVGVAVVGGVAGRGELRLRLVAEQLLARELVEEPQ